MNFQTCAAEKVLYQTVEYLTQTGRIRDPGSGWQAISGVFWTDRQQIALHRAGSSRDVGV